MCLSINIARAITLTSIHLKNKKKKLNHLSSYHETSHLNPLNCDIYRDEILTETHFWDISLQNHHSSLRGLESQL